MIIIHRVTDEGEEVAPPHPPEVGGTSTSGQHGAKCAKVVARSHLSVIWGAGTSQHRPRRRAQSSDWDQPGGRRLVCEMGQLSRACHRRSQRVD